MRLYIIPLLAVVLASFACSSAGNPIVFTSDINGNREIFSLYPENAELVNLTKSAGGEYAPSLSPDGSHIAFLAGDDEHNTLQVIALNTEADSRTHISKIDGSHRDHRWSPSSDRLAYLVQNGGEPSTHVAGYDGSNSMELTTIVAHEVGGWSFDGSSVVFAVREGPGQGIYIRNPDGVNEVRLTDQYDYSPAWSPNSHKIAFISERDGNPEIYIMNSDATELRRITESSGGEYDIAWSPDGRKIAFASDRDGNPEIYVVDVRGGEVSRLTRNSVRDDQPVWSRDGKRIAFVSYLDGDGEIVMMDNNGQNQRRLTNNGYDDYAPTW
jgi:TolB protein